ncbi:MAG TPA: hypothetical protein DDZ53_05370 [Firmicutes bacterium]|jgi:hypothetical protein|nr:hypothetical protein [Bacillota bacterium]
MAKPSAKKTNSNNKQGKPATTNDETLVDHGEVLLSWKVRPYLLEKRKAAILVISTLLFSALVWYAFDLSAGLLTLVICLGAFASFLLPSDYQLTEKGLRVKSGINAPVFRKWRAFKDYRVFPDGINLIYHPRQIRERLLKAQFVYYGDADASAIQKLITERMDSVMGKAE